jgi:hypothetical protein
MAWPTNKQLDVEAYSLGNDYLITMGLLQSLKDEILKLSTWKKPIAGSALNSVGKGAAADVAIEASEGVGIGSGTAMTTGANNFIDSDPQFLWNKLWIKDKFSKCGKPLSLLPKKKAMTFIAQELAANIEHLKSTFTQSEKARQAAEQDAAVSNAQLQATEQRNVELKSDLELVRQELKEVRLVKPARRYLFSLLSLALWLFLHDILGYLTMA